MAVIQSFNQIENLTPPWYAGINRSAVRLYDQRNYEYSTLYRVQTNVRTCVDFLSRNVAQLGLHQFEFVSETDRVRLRDFGMTKLLAKPLPAKYKVTRYRFIEALMGDLGIYFNAYVLKIRDDDGAVIGLLRIPAPYIQAQGSLVITGYKLRVGGLEREIPAEDVIHIRGYNPENPITGLSSLETLRRILAEEDSTGKYREELWQNSARMSGFIERPSDAGDWSEKARKRFLTEFAELYAGEGKGGKTAVLEDGMTWRPAAFSAREAEYLGSRKLTREECARAFHIPLPMVGILDNATFSNIREQHKQLYQDSLGPWLTMIEQDIDLQLLPDFESEGIEYVYSEFNILEKLQGSFEEQIKAIQTAVGRPWMSADEGRAVLNLRSRGGDADELVLPLNVTVGGQPVTDDTNPKGLGGHKLLSAKAFSVYSPSLIERYRLKWIEVLSKFFMRQERSIVSRVNPAVGAAEDGKSEIGEGVWWDTERWDAELFHDVMALNLATSLGFADVLLDQTGVYADNPDGRAAFEDRLNPLLTEHSRIQAQNTNQITQDQIVVALGGPDPLAAVKKVFSSAVTVRALQQAVSAVTFGSNFGAHEAAQASSLVSKKWRVNSSNPRASHAALDGVSVGIRETFANGLRWPGDPRGSVDELAGCDCSVEFTR